MNQKAGKLNKGQNMLNGAMILVAATLIVKVIGAVYKIPLTALIGEVGRGYFSSAYELYTPIYAIAMAGLPVAVSKMVSENRTLGKYRDSESVFKIAYKLFLIIGIVGTVFLLAISIPYVYFAKSPGNIWSLLAIAPSIFFCSLMSTYRGYYEGMRNMTPTAVSQVIEALGKLVLGLVLAKLTMNYGMAKFEAGKEVFGKVCASHAEALSATYPFAAAGAVLGVTLGTVAAYLYCVIRKKLGGDGVTKEMLDASPEPADNKILRSTMIKIAIPMAISALIMNVTNLIDNFTVRTRLAYAVAKNLEYFKTAFAASLQGSGTLDADIQTYLYGCYFSALDFKNLIATVTMALGVSAIPAIAAAQAKKSKSEIGSTINSVMRMCMFIAAPAGFGIAVLATPLMTLLYGGTNAENLIRVASPIVAIYGWSTCLFALSTPLTNVLQALGRADIPAKIIAVGAGVKVICNFIFVGMPKLNIYGATIGTIVCYIIIVALLIQQTVKISGCKIDFVSTSLKPLICAAICAVSAWGARSLLVRYLTFGSPDSRLNGANVATLISVAVAAAVYFAGILLSRGIAREDIIMLPKGEKIAKVLEKYKLLG